MIQTLNLHHLHRLFNLAFLERKFHVKLKYVEHAMLDLVILDFFTWFYLLPIQDLPHNRDDHHNHKNQIQNIKLHYAKIQTYNIDQVFRRPSNTRSISMKLWQNPIDENLSCPAAREWCRSMRIFMRW